MVPKPQHAQLGSMASRAPYTFPKMPSPHLNHVDPLTPWFFVGNEGTRALIYIYIYALRDWPYIYVLRDSVGYLIPQLDPLNTKPSRSESKMQSRAPMTKPVTWLPSVNDLLAASEILKGLTAPSSKTHEVPRPLPENPQPKH